MKKIMLILGIAILSVHIFASGSKDLATESKSIEVWMINSPNFEL